VAMFFASFMLPVKGILAAIVYGALIAGVIYWLLQRGARWRSLIPATTVVIVAGAFLVSLFPSFMQMKVEFFPASDEDYLIIEVELPEGSVLGKTELETR